MKRRLAAISLATAAVGGLGLINAQAAPASAPADHVAAETASGDGCFRVGHYWVCPA